MKRKNIIMICSTIFIIALCFVLAGNSTFAANKKGNTYCVKYDANGGKGSYIKDKSVKCGKNYKIKKNKYKKSGYTFDGWRDNTGKRYKEKQIIKGGFKKILRYMLNGEAKRI